MVELFYTTYISVDLAHDEIFCAKVGKSGIKHYVLEFIGLDHVIRESNYKGTIIQRIYTKWTFSYNSFVNCHGIKLGAITRPC